MPEQYHQQPSLSELDDNELRDEIFEEINRRPALRGLMRQLRKDTYDVSLKLDSSTWESSFAMDFHKKILRLRIGRAVMDKETKRELCYMDQKFSELDTVIFQTMHELSHVMINMTVEDPQWQDSLESLYDMILSMRISKRGGLTTLGNLQYYHTKNPKNPYEYPSKEDLTQLITMAVYDPQYFKSYLSTLQSTRPNAVSYKKDRNIATLTALEIHKIQSVIEALISAQEHID